MNVRFRHHELRGQTRGMAYLGVLLLVLLLTVTALSFIVSVRVSGVASAGRLEALQARYLAESAANHALWRLINEASIANYIVSNIDDSEQEDEGAEPYGPKLELGRRDYVGLRFINVAIPQGATVNVARVQFMSSDDDNAFTVIGIDAEDTDNAPAFTSNDHDLSGRSWTSAFVSWVDVPSWSKDVSYESPDLSPVIQEIVNRPGWVEGNSIVLFFTSFYSSGQRRFYAHDESDKTPAMLTVSHGAQDPMTSTDYTMHPLANGRYGYKVRLPSPTTFASIATVGAAGKSAVKQSYVVYMPQEDTTSSASVDKVSVKENANVKSAKWGHAVANGNNRLLVVCGSVHGTRTMQTVSYDGLPLAHHGTVFSESSLRHVSMWYLVNPPTGNKDVAVTFSGKTHFTLASVSFFGVDQSAPLGNFESTSGNSSLATISVPSASGQLVLDTMVATDESGPVNPAFGQAQLWSKKGGDNVWGAGSIKEGGGTVSTYWTLSRSRKWATGAVTIRPATP